MEILEREMTLFKNKYRIKSAVTKIIRQSIPEFSWQSRFYDHMIRNEISLYNIRRYINYNPKMWNRDRNNKFRIGDVI